MKRVLLSAGLILILLTSLQFGQNLGHPTLLIHTDGSVRWTQCAFGPDSTLWVVWVPGTTNPNSGGPVWVASYDGTTVSTPFNVTESNTVMANRPHIATSVSGDVLVTWGVVNSNSTFLRVYDFSEKAWLPIETMAGGDASWEPCGQIDKYGNIHIVSNVYAGGRTFARSKINGVWEDIVPLTLGYGEQSSIALDSQGTVHAVLIEKMDSGSYENFYTSRTSSTGWYTREPIPGEEGSSALPWISVGPDNVPVVVWMDYPNPLEEGGTNIKVMKIQGGAQSQNALDNYMQHFPRVVVDSNNNIHVVAQAGAGDAGDGLRYTNNIGGTWKQVQTIPANAPKVIGLAADMFGNVAASMSSWLSYSVELGTDIYIYSLYPIVASPLPTAEFTFTPTTGYPPLTVNFSATPSYSRDGQEVSYDWVFGDGATASGRDVTHVYETAGTYPVELTVVDDIGRSDSAIQTVEVMKTNPIPPLNLSSTIALSRFWKNPEITFNLFWAINPGNIPEHIVGYTVYMKEDNGVYKQLLAVSAATLSASFKFTDLKKKRTFAILSRGLGGTESEMVYFR